MKPLFQGVNDVAQQVAVGEADGVGSAPFGDGTDHVLVDQLGNQVGTLPLAQVG
jgi:hypothetical protein